MVYGATSFVLAMALAVLVCSSQETPEKLRADAREMQIKADSLKRVWGVQWKRSDSIRIESMFVRMRSDSLRRLAKALITKADVLERPVTDSLVSIDSTIRSTVDAELRLREHVEQAQRSTPKPGQTLSDSSTFALMMVESDSGLASYYAEAFHGRKTSSGERYDMNDLTCAHRWLPYNTRIRVTNLANGRSCVVRVNDRGPWKHTRLIDVSKAAAKELDMIRSGTTRVELKVVVEE